jgi:hypothetical protein
MSRAEGSRPLRQFVGWQGVGTATALVEGFLSAVASAATRADKSPALTGKVTHPATSSPAFRIWT